MTGQKIPDKSTSKANNGKHPREDEDDEQVAANSSGLSESSTKRRRTSHDSTNEGDFPVGNALPNNQNQDELSSSDFSDESLSDIDADVDDLESIHEFDIEDLGEFEAFGDHYDPITGEYNYSEAENEDEGEELIEPPSSPMSDSGQFWGRQDPPQRPQRGFQSWTNCHGGKELLRLVMADGVESDTDDEI
ncbi:hypothetical protein QQZ08_006961 [Neonectria magnoliae]|uniref:Uncharacterized protein n=1 Tax=Neonectria magnoliae TaxID=2732573 RepID=A0ABR1HYY5_9HYPO